jgi:prepilin-type N-terminal cleavage/methylation domain-containing protein
MKKGFTLIELLITVALITIVTSFLLINYPGLNKAFSLQRSVSKLSQDIRKIEERSVSMVEISGNPPEGYGIHIDEESYSYKLSAYDKNGNWSATDTWEETINIEDEIKIGELKKGDATVASLDIVFEPPDPTVWVNNSSSSSSTIEVYIENDSSKSESIFINSSGLITVK